MSRGGETMLAWGDGTYPFALRIGELRGLQEKTDTGPQVLFRRLADGTWRVDDARHVLFFGLVGGGMPPVEATALVRRWCEERPLSESILPACVVLHAALFGVADESVGKAEAPPAATEQTEQNSPPTTAPAP